MHHTADETRPLLKGRRPTPLPKAQIAILVLLQLAEPVTSHCIYPFINQLVSELDITGGDERKVGYYAGMIQSIFFATEAIFVIHWARLSDHIGRKPVLLIGLGGLCISMLWFGLSKTFLTLILSRSLVGTLNANTGVIKSMIGELTDSTNMAQGFAWVPVAWAMGTTIAPMMGGQLAKPHDRWPHIFSNSFWVKYPYFLPCAASAAFSVITFVIATLFLKETVKRRSRSDDEGPEAQIDEQTKAPPPFRAVLTRPVIISIANNGVLALAEIEIIALLPLFLSTPITLGGLGLDPPSIGIILGVLGILDGLFQALFFSRIVGIWGPKRVFQVSLSMLIPLYLLFPLENLYAKAHGLTPAVWTLVALQLLMLIVLNMAFGTMCMFITSSVPNRRSFGAVNGLAQFVGSVCRAIGPAASTSLFATSLERDWLGGYAVYFILIALNVALLFTTRLLPRDMWQLDGDVRRDRDGQ